jgi:hypothetical protein
MITVKEFTNHIEAAMLQSFLKDNDIDSVLADEHSSAWGRAPMLIPIRLQVPEDQAETAISLIRKFEEAPALPEADAT